MDEPIRPRLDDEWNSRDLSVSAARLSQRGALDLGMSDLVAIELGITEERASNSLRALHDAGYLEAVEGGASLGGPSSVLAINLRERGRRAIGIWPSGHAVDALVDALRQAAEATDDAEEQALIRRAAGAVGSVSRDIMVDVVAAVIARQSGVG